MWIREVDIPEALVEAHRSGELVLFVGAGASRAEPSSLPDFRLLTKAVAADFNVDVSDEQLDKLDVLLGELDDNPDFDVHSRVAARIGDPTSRPNQLHQAIAALAAAGPPVRMVTTNYDLHLSAALAAAQVQADQYMAPALPMGDDFTGAVYLHGSLLQEPRALVVTDADFGRAYLRDAWATRFLERMFSRFTVLFVGYSHDDVVVSYLARGLGRSSSRFVLTSTPDKSDWRRLGIIPIGYPNEDGTHSALAEALEGWESWASMGMLGHRQRVAELVAAAPPQVPEEAAYLEAIVGDPGKVGLFTELARGEAWLGWAATHPEFRLLFESAVPITDCTRPLAYWFAEQLLADEETCTRALSIHQSAGGRLRPEMWSALSHRLLNQARPLPTWLGPWIVLLVQNDPGWANSHLLEMVLANSTWPDEASLARLLFEHLSEPIVQYRRSFGLEDHPRLELRVRGDAYWLDKSWENAFAPNLADAAPDVIAIVDHHLRRAHRLLQTADSSDTTMNLWSSMRPAIEDLPETPLRGPSDILIRAGRESLEALLADNIEIATGYLASWAATDVPLLRRLALHGWIERKDVDATTKLQWLLSQGWLFGSGLRHEVFRLMQMTLPEADTGVADLLVEQAVEGPAAINDPERRDYQVFSVVTWINQHAPDLQSASDALDAVRELRPDFEPRDHPDLTMSWAYSTSPGPVPPITAAELHDQIGSDPAAALQELMRFRDATGAFDSPNWSGVRSVIAETVTLHPSDGLTILNASEDEPDVLSAVIHGWEGATLDQEAAEAIFTTLAAIDLTPVVDDVAELLLAGGQDTNEPPEWTRSAAAYDLAAAAWSALDQRETHDEPHDWLGVAINDPAGKLTQFHVNAIAAEWRAAGDSWSGLPEAARGHLEDLISTGDHRAAMAETVLASKVHFFSAADSTWCDSHVLPLLDWSEPARARRAWDGYLYWGRWNDHLLNAGLLTAYIETAAHIGSFPDDLRHRLCEHLAFVALVSEVHPLDNGWLTNFTSKADAGTRTDWMHEISSALRQLPPENAEHQWERWMQRYWVERVAGVPLQLTEDEVAAMANWILHLTQSTDQAVDLATKRPARLAEHSAFLHQLTTERIQRSPAALARLVTHLLQGTEPPFYDGYSLKEAVTAFKAQSPPIDTAPIIEQALRLGWQDAPGW
ncbi:MAG TPA: DUF4020 domain-containing protein [Acidimicrobiales bacterium]|jgi:hypothetical protein